jgi:hypothetical protein
LFEIQNYENHCISKFHYNLITLFLFDFHHFNGSIMTTRSIDPKTIAPILQTIQDQGKLLIHGLACEKDRTTVLAAARELVAALETPHEIVGRMNWLDVSSQIKSKRKSPNMSQMSRHVAVRVGLDLDIFTKLAEADGAPKSAAQLAEATGCDPKLLSKLFLIFSWNHVLIP